MTTHSAKNALTAYAVSELIYSSHQGTANELLIKLAAATDSKTIAELAFCYCRKSLRLVPCEYDADELTRIAYSYNQYIHSDTLSAIDKYIAKECTKRQDRALALISMTDKKYQHNYKQINQLDEIDADIASGVILLSAPHGMGKTRQVGVPFARNEIASCVTTMCHSKSLTFDMSNLFNAANYEEEGAAIKDIAHNASISHADAHQHKSIDRLSICLPSIVLALEERVRATKTLVIDEVAQVLSFILSDTVKYSDVPNVNAVNIYNRLVATVSSAERILAMDADLDDSVIHFIEKCRPNERITIYELLRKNERYSIDWCYDRKYKAKAEAFILAQLSEHKRLIIGCDSQTLTSALQTLISKYDDSLKVLRIDSSTSTSKEVKKFLENPSKNAHKYDVVIHSPSVRSGVSIQPPKAEDDDFLYGCFDEGVYIFGGKSIGSSDAIQMMRRDRSLKRWTLFVGSAHNESAMTANQMTTAQQIADCIQADMQERNATRATEFDLFVNEQRSKEQRSKEDFANNLYYQLQAYHFKIERADIECEEKSATVAIAKEEKVQFELAVISAPVITERDYLDLSQRNNLTLEQKAQKVAFEIREFMQCENIDVQTLKTWDEGRIKSKARLLARVINPQIEEITQEPISVKAYRDVRARLLAGAMRMAGIEVSREGISGVIDKEHQESVKGWANDNRVLLAYLGLISKELANPKAKIKCSKKLINGMLEKIGVETISKSVRKGERCDNKTIRLLSINEQAANHMLSIANHQKMVCTFPSIYKQKSAKCTPKNMHQVAYSEQSAKREKDGREDALEFGGKAKQLAHDMYEFLSQIEISKSRHMNEVGNNLLTRGWTEDRVNEVLHIAMKSNRVNFDISSETFIR